MRSLNTISLYKNEIFNWTLSFAKNIGKNLSNKYGQKILARAKKSTTDAIKTASNSNSKNSTSN